MSNLSYGKALDDLLKPLGFTRDRNNWARTRGDMLEVVNLQVSAIAGVTANLQMHDRETARIVSEIPSKEPLFLIIPSMRIGELIDGYDRWWKKDPKGPTELSEAVRRHGLPYFDRVRTLEEQAAHWYGRGSQKGWHGQSLIGLAVTLYRMGQVEEACAELSRPTPKTAIPSSVAGVQSVRQWLGCDGPEVGPSQKPSQS